MLALGQYQREMLDEVVRLWAPRRAEEATKGRVRKYMTRKEDMNSLHGSVARNEGLPKVDIPSQVV